MPKDREQSTPEPWSHVPNLESFLQDLYTRGDGSVEPTSAQFSALSARVATNSVVSVDLSPLSQAISVLSQQISSLSQVVSVMSQALSNEISNRISAVSNISVLGFPLRLSAGTSLGISVWTDAATLDVIETRGTAEDLYVRAGGVLYLGDIAGNTNIRVPNTAGSGTMRFRFPTADWFFQADRIRIEHASAALTFGVADDVVIERAGLSALHISAASTLIAGTLVAGNSVVITGAVISAQYLDLASVQSNIGAISATLASVQSNVGAVSATLASVISQVSLISLNVAANSATLTSVQSQVSLISLNVATNSATLTSVQSQVSLISLNVAANSATLTSVQSNVGAISATLASVQSNVGAISATLASVISQVSLISLNVAANSATLTSVQSQVSLISLNVAANSATLTSIQSQVSLISLNVAANSATLTSVQSQISLISLNVAANSATLTSVQSQVSLISLNVATNSATLTSVQSQISAISDKLSSVGIWAVRGLSGIVSGASTVNMAADAVTFYNPTNKACLMVSGVAAVTNNVGGGTAANGQDQAAAFTSSVWLHLYFVLDGTTVKTRSSLTAPPTGPTLQGTEKAWAYAAAIRRDTSNALVLCYLRGCRMTMQTPISVITGGTATAETTLDYSTIVPPNARFIENYLQAKHGDVTNSANLNFRLITGVDWFVVPMSAIVAGAQREENPFFTFPNVGQALIYYWGAALTSRSATVLVLSYTVPNGDM